MRRWFTFLVLFISFGSSVLYGQKAVKVELNGTAMRKPLTVSPGKTLIELSGLNKGETYAVISNFASAGQSVPPNLDATTELSNKTNVSRIKNRSNTLQFKAPAHTAQFWVTLPATAKSMQNDIFLSIKCETCAEDETWKQKFKDKVEMVNLSTTGGTSASSLISNTLIGGNCFDVTNITSSGNSASRGTFTNGTSNIGIANGVVLCTGNVNILPGPNTSQGINGGFGTNSPDDPDLATLTNGNQYDVSKIEFDFTPTAATVQFDFVFASDEYCEYVGSQFNDVFGFFISGPGITGTQNIALIPSTTTAVAINNVNHNTNSSYYVNNNNNAAACNNLPPYNLAECEMDGWTSVFTATANVTPCSTYHIKLAIADIGDSQFASAVFLKANSFNAGGQGKAVSVYPGGQNFVYEDCGNGTGYIRFVRGSGDLSQPLVINFTVGGTATPGVDYTPSITSPVTIPAGQTEILIPITALGDLIIEGDETIILTLDNACSCTQQTMTFTIRDKPPVEVDVNDVTQCGTSPVTLTPSVTGGLAPFTYHWSTGANTQSITVNTPGTHTYTVTVTDNCGGTGTDETTVTINPAPTANLTGSGVLCTGSSTPVNLTLTMTGVGPWDVTYNAAGSTVTETFTTSPTVITVTDPGNYSLVSVTSANGCTGTATGNINIQQITVNLNVTPNDPTCFGSNNGNAVASANGGSNPFTYSWSSGGSGTTANNLGPGTYTVTVTNGNGCTSTQSFTLTEPPLMTASIASSTNINCSTPQGNADLVVDGGTPGYNFNWSNGSHNEDPTFTAGGTYTVTVTDSKGCTKTANVTITANTTLPTAVIAPPQSITCANTVITLNASGSSQGSNFTYEWSGPSFVCCDNTLQPQVDQGGTYIITVTNTDNGCTKTASVNVTDNNNPPAVNINTPPNIGCTTPTISLNGNGSATGSGITYQWSTPDGNIVSGGTTLNPQVNQAGSYTLVVTNGNTGCTSSATVTVSGNTIPPDANIAAPGIVNCNTPEITLDASGSSQGGNFTYNWSGPSGGINGGGNTTNPQVDQAGTYTITVTNTDNNCTATASVTVTSNLAQPTAVAAPPATLTCAVTSITINGNGSSTGSNFTYEWTTSGGNIVSGETTLNPVVDQPGSYTLVVTNTENGCTKSVTVNVPQNINQPNANINTPGNIGCTTPTITLNGAGSSTGSGITYQWTTSGGNIVSGGTTLNPQVNQAGTYTLVVTNGNNGCTNEATVTVTGNTIVPTANIAPPGIVNCNTPEITLDASGSSQGGNFTYNWSGPAGGINGGGNSTNPQVDQAGTYIITVTDTDNNCTATASVTVTSNLAQPTAVAAPPATLTCAVTSITINGTGSSTGPNFTYEWTTAGGNIVSGETTLNPVVDQPGSYTLVVTNTDNGCTKSVTVTVPENTNLPNVNINTPANIGCTMPTITLSGSGSSTGSNFTYQWTTSDGNIVSGGTTLNPQVNLAGTYTLVVTNTTTGCTNQESVTVSGNTVPPVATINPPPIVDCYTPEITLDASGSSQGSNFTYNWSGPAGGINGGGNSTNPQVDQPGTYTITVTNTDNNCTTTATVSVTANLTPPTAVIAPPALLTCQVPTITLNGNGSSTGSNFTYEWTTGNGNIVSGETTLQPTVNQPGTYVLVVTNTTNGCTKSATVTVSSNQNFPIANAGPSLVLNCTHPTLQIQGSGSTGAGFTLNWMATPGNIVSGGNTFTPTVNQGGFYILTVTNTTNGCTAQDVVEVSENFSTPVAVVAPPQIITCDFPEIELDGSASTQGPEITYQWSSVPPNGIISGGNTSNPLINKAGTYTLTVTNTESGCTAVTQVVVTQNITPPTANAGPGGQLSCQAPTLTLNGTGSTGPNFDYQWTTGNGNIVSGEYTLTPTVDAGGQYTLIVHNNVNGCTASSTVSVTVNQNFPVATAGPDLEMNCQNMGLVELNGTGTSTGPTYTYQWTANPGNIVSGGSSLKPKVNAGGFYTLLVTNTANGCTAEDEVWVNDNIIYPIPDILPPQQLNCTYTSINLDATGSTTSASGAFTWTAANGGHIVTGANTAYPEVDKPGTYNLVIVNQDNYCTATATVNVTQNITLPNAVATVNGVLTCQFPQIDLNGQGSSSGPEFFYEWTTTNGNIVSGNLTLTPTVSQPGQYLLTVFNNDNGCTKTANVQVTSSAIFPVANAGTPENLTCAVAQLTLNGSSSSQGTQYSYVWTTPNGNIVSGANTLNPVVNQPGQYDLVVVNAQNGCTAVATVAVGTDYVIPSATVAPGGILSCTTTALSLDGAGSSTGTGFTYNWTTQNGNFVSGQTTLTPVVNAVGSYTLVVTNSTNGCTQTATTSVAADASLPTANAGTVDTLNCTVQQQTLNGNGSSQGGQYTYQWTGPGIVSGPTTLSPVVNQPGLYELLVTNTSNGCTAISAITVPQDIDHPIAEAGLPAQLDCVHLVDTINASASSAGAVFQYVWTTNGGNILSGGNTLSPVVNQPGAYLLLITNTANGCTSTDMVTITQDIALPVAEAGPPGLITCTNPTVTLSGSGSTGSQFQYTWSTTNGNIASGSNSLSPVTDAPGTYNLLITNINNGCTATDNVIVNKDANVPVAQALVNGELNCTVHQLQLSGGNTSQGGTITYNWTTNGGNIVSGGNTLTPTIDAPGIYTLNVFNSANNCQAISSIDVNLNVTAPVANAGLPAIISCLNPILTLNGNGSSQGPSYTYNWSAQNGGILSGINTLTPQIDHSGFYTLLVTDQTNGCTAESTVQIVLDQNTPEANPGPEPTLTCTVLTIAINGTGSSSGNQFTYAWTASNGGTILSGANTLTPVAGTPGTYTLLVSNATNGCTSQASVNVNQDIMPPVANAGAAPTLTCANTTVSLNGSGSSVGQIYTYAWTGPDIVSGGNTVSPVVGDPGQYNLLVTNTQNGCTSTSLVNVPEDVVPPLAAAAVAGELTCSVTALPLSGTGSSTGSIYNYQWTTTNGIIVSDPTTLTPTVSKPGLYKLLVTNASNGCTETASVTVTQNITNPTADAGASQRLTCTVLQLNLNGTGNGGVNGVSYAWSGPGIVSGGNTNSPTIGATGVYVLTVTDGYNGCTSTDQVQVIPDVTPPVITIAQPGILTCQVTTVFLSASGSSGGAQFGYQWTGPGIVSGPTTLTPSVNLPGTYNLLITNSNNGCTSSAGVNVTQDVEYPLAEAGNGFELTCSVEFGNLSANGSSAGNQYAYAWSTQDGHIVSGTNSANPLVNEKGNYQLLVTNTLTGCTSTDMVLVTENTNYPSKIDLSTDLPACGGQPGSIQFDEITGGVGPYLYSIDNGANFLSAASFTNLTPGVYNLVVQDVNGCEYSESLTFPVPLEPQINIQPEIALEFGESATLTAFPNIPPYQIDTIIWSPAESLTFTNKPNVVIAKPFANTMYTVTLINKDGCEDRAQVLVKVGEPHIWAPNVFSPQNQDGVNDYFLIFAAEKSVKNIPSLQIYDRWGNQVFYGENITPNVEKMGWDGRFRGVYMNPAVFVWWAEVELESGQKIVMKGDVTLVR